MMEDAKGRKEDEGTRRKIDEGKMMEGKKEDDGRKENDGRKEGRKNEGR